MVKAIGSAIIILASTLLGIKKYISFFERRKLLQEIYNGSVAIRESIRCLCLPLYDCFLYGGDFFRKASEKIESGLLPGEAVNESAASYHILTDEDKQCIARFAKGLCAEDYKGQLSNLDLFIKDMEKALNQATTELNTRGKLYIKGSILTATAVVLLLI